VEQQVQQLAAAELQVALARGARIVSSVTPDLCHRPLSDDCVRVGPRDVRAGLASSAVLDRFGEHARAEKRRMRSGSRSPTIRRQLHQSTTQRSGIHGHDWTTRRR